MVYKIVITEQAKEDTQTAYDYYEKQRQDLGEEFLQELIKRYDDLADHPQHLSPSKKDTETGIVYRKA